RTGPGNSGAEASTGAVTLLGRAGIVVGVTWCAGSCGGARLAAPESRITGFNTIARFPVVAIQWRSGGALGGDGVALFRPVAHVTVVAVCRRQAATGAVRETRQVPGAADGIGQRIALLVGLHGAIATQVPRLARGGLWFPSVRGAAAVAVGKG